MLYLGKSMGGCAASSPHIQAELLCNKNHRLILLDMNCVLQVFRKSIYLLEKIFC